MSFYNFRRVKYKATEADIAVGNADPGGYSYSIAEVYYDNDGNISMWAPRPIHANNPLEFEAIFREVLALPILEVK